MKKETKQITIMTVAILFIVVATLGLVLPLWELSVLLQIVMWIIVVLSILVFCWVDGWK